MAKKVAKRPSTGNGQRGKRYATLAALKAAVERACLDEIDEALGWKGGAEEWRKTIRADFEAENSPAEVEAFDILSDLRSALIRGERFFYESGATFARSPDGFLLGARLEGNPGFNTRTLVGAMAQLLDRAGPTLHGLHGGEAPPDAGYLRSWIIRWHAQMRPPVTDVRRLALLSLLVGSFPKAMAKRQEDSRARPTVSDVIDAERREIAKRAAADRKSSESHGLGQHDGGARGAGSNAALSSNAADAKGYPELRRLYVARMKRFNA